MSLVDAAESVILVTPDDREVGLAGKLEAHRQGLLHRALSVVLRDSRGRTLLQKRHIGKYHSGGLWTNSCCSHPRAGEPVDEAARRRLREEMGIDCPLEFALTVHYRAELDNAMIEHEVVHVFLGLYDGPVRPDPLEADGYDWIRPEALRADIAASPDRYSFWFRKYCIEHWGRLRLD